jgi:hypothetical protein
MNYEVSLDELAVMAPGRRKALGYLSYVLSMDGAHHKVWLAEQAILALGGNLEEVGRYVVWEPGIPP